MKVYSILRGIPGLGRMVGSLALLENLGNIGYQIRIASYGQAVTTGVNFKGLDINKVKAYSKDNISSIGIIPVSKFGEEIFCDIKEWNPDIIICDGEPLMIEALYYAGFKKKVVAIANRLDIKNPNNQWSSEIYFSKLYSYAELVIVHGLWNDNIVLSLPKSYYKLNTMIRPEIISLKTDVVKSKIVGIIGGGTWDGGNNFRKSAVRFIEIINELAKYDNKNHFVIYCNDVRLAKCCDEYFDDLKVDIISKYTSPQNIYKDAKLVLARGGRNTLSELIYLKIPAIAYASYKNDYRSGEQGENITIANQISNGLICEGILDDSISVWKKLYTEQLGRSVKEYSWKPGNQEAVKIIKSFFKDI